MSSRSFNQWSPTDSSHLVVLHPNYRGRPILSELLVDKSHTLVFTAFGKDANTFESVWLRLGEALESQLQVVLPPLRSDVTLLEAAEVALEVLRPFAPFRLIFDLGDDMVGKLSLPFAYALANQLVADSQIFLMIREWYHELQLPMPNGELPLLTPLDSVQMLPDYREARTGRTILEVFGQGNGTVKVNGQTVRTWDGVLPKNLFFYFVDRGIATRDAIFQSFWPKLPVKDATNVFHVTKRKINESIGFDLTTYQSGYYVIRQDVDLHYDVVKFTEILDRVSSANASQASELLKTALNLYRGTYLSNAELEWIAVRREYLQSRYTEVLTQLARIYTEQERHEESLSLALRAFSTQPYREDFAVQAMERLLSADQPQRACTIYERLIAALKRRGMSVRLEKHTKALGERARKSAT